MAEAALTLDLTMPRKAQAASAFGERLAELRAERGITQIQLAEMIGSSQRAVSDYETVAEFPTTPVAVALARALEVSADELLGLAPPKKSRASQEDPEARRLRKKFLQVMRLPEKDRRAFIRPVNSLVETKGREATGGAR
ncbi:MAG: helix-turn-helix transcriptional regulator [Deltaproteobacteria bacterium]|nr:helix-turn-helix transcriptional regulator [Deltaproteobacteria bacterium]